MAVYSMTGYAHAQDTEATGLGLEIRSVNSRFLDIAFRLPDELRAQEPQLRELIAAQLRRGKVEVRAALERSDNASLSDPPARLLQRLAALQDQVRTWLPDAQALSVSQVLQYRAGDTPQPAQLGAALLQLAATALQALAAAREREGRRLTDMLKSHVAQLRALTQQAQPLVPQLVEQYRQRFLERWNEAMAQTGAEAPHERALAEATAFAIRIDIAEELTRLAAHLDEIERLLKKGGEVGKRLDFLIQELHREANTLGSKAAALELTRIAVDMKVLIEQMREQVQNLE